MNKALGYARVSSANGSQTVDAQVEKLADAHQSARHKRIGFSRFLAGLESWSVHRSTDHQHRD